MNREPGPLRSGFHLRRRPMPGVCAAHATQSRLPDQRGHRHRALWRPLPFHARGQSPLCRTGPGGPRRDLDRANRIIPQTQTWSRNHPDAPSSGAVRTPVPDRPENPISASRQSHDSRPGQAKHSPDHANDNQCHRRIQLECRIQAKPSSPHTTQSEQKNVPAT